MWGKEVDESTVGRAVPFETRDPSSNLAIVVNCIGLINEK